MEKERSLAILLIIKRNSNWSNNIVCGIYHIYEFTSSMMDGSLTTQPRKVRVKCDGSMTNCSD